MRPILEGKDNGMSNDRHIDSLNVVAPESYTRKNLVE